VIERFVLDGAFPAFARFGLFCSRNLVHDLLPGSLGRSGITCRPVNAGAVMAKARMLLGFVPGGDEAIRFVLVACVKGLLFFGDEVFAIEGAPVASEDTEACFHFMLHVVSMNCPFRPRLAGCGRVTSGSLEW